MTEKTPGQIAFANYTYVQPNDTIAGHGWENLPPSIKSNWEESAAAVLAAAADDKCQDLVEKWIVATVNTPSDERTAVLNYLRSTGKIHLFG